MNRLVPTLTLLCAAVPVAAEPTAADVGAVKAFVSDDRSYAPGAKTEADRLAAALPAHLAQPARFELEVARIVALADNGHTAYFPAQFTLRYPRSPVRLGLFADGLFIIAAPGDHAPALGKAVATVNGRDWRELRSALAAYQGGTQSFRDQFLPYFLETPAILDAAGFGGEPDTLRLGLVDGRELAIKAERAPLEGESAFLGEPQLRTAAHLVAGDAPLYLQRGDQLYDFVALPDLQAAYIRLDAIGGDGLKPFLTASLERLRAGDQRSIILDLRFNMGGDLNRARDFAQALPALAKGGRVYAITSGRTFSAAISTTGYLKQAGGDKVVIVGEPIGDRLEFWAEGGFRELPGNGAKLLLATERHNYQTGCPEADCHASIREHPIRVSSLQPEIAAPMAFAAFRAGRDPAMEAIERDIRSR